MHRPDFPGVAVVEIELNQRTGEEWRALEAMYKIRALPGSVADLDCCWNGVDQLLGIPETVFCLPPNIE